MLSMPNDKAVIEATERFRSIMAKYPTVAIRVDNLPDNKEDADFITEYIFLAASEAVPRLIRRINFLESKLTENKETGHVPDKKPQTI
jgi:hypothetical protein